MINDPISPESQDYVDEVRRRVRGGDRILSKSAKGAYTAFLGYYLGQMKRIRMKRKEDLVEIANDFATLSGLSEPPAITKMLIGKMGLKGVSGLNVSGGQDGADQGNSGRRNPHNGHQDGRRAPKSNYGRRR